MAITSRDKQELDQLYSDYGQKFGGCKQDYFALIYLRRKFKCALAPVYELFQTCFVVG